MTNASEDLNKELSEIISHFPEFSPQTIYNQSDRTFYIFVSPEELDQNDLFNELCGKLIVRLTETHPDRYVCFLTSRSLTKIKDLERYNDLPDRRLSF